MKTVSHTLSPKAHWWVFNRGDSQKECVFFSTKKLGVWLFLVNTGVRAWSHDLPLFSIFINESKVGAQQMPIIAFSCKIKFLTVLFFLTESLIVWTIRAGMPAAPASLQICPKLHSRDIQHRSEQTWPHFSWLHSFLFPFFKCFASSRLPRAGAVLKQHRFSGLVL